MPRLVLHTATGPSELKTPKGDSIWICRCGLTTNADGTCNSNHKKLRVAEEEKGKVYRYDEDGERSECKAVSMSDGKSGCKSNDDCKNCGDEKSQGCCGGGCC